MRRDEERRDKERRGEGERNFHGDSRNITEVRREVEEEVSEKILHRDLLR